MSSSKEQLSVRPRVPHKKMLEELAFSRQLTPPPEENDDPAYTVSCVKVLTASQHAIDGDVKQIRFDLSQHGRHLSDIDARVDTVDAKADTVGERVEGLANELLPATQETASSGGRGASTYSWENKFDAIELHFSEVNERIDQVDDKLQSMEESIDELGVSVEQLDQRHNHLERRMENLEGRMARIEGRMDKLEGRMSVVEEKLDRLMNRDRYRVNAFVERGSLTKNGLLLVRDYWSLHLPEKFHILIDELDMRDIVWEPWALAEYEDSGDLDPPPSTHLEAVSRYPAAAVEQLFTHMGLRYNKIKRQVQKLEKVRVENAERRALKRAADGEADERLQSPKRLQPYPLYSGSSAGSTTASE